MARGALIAIAGAVLLGTLAVDAHGETLTVQVRTRVPAAVGVPAPPGARTGVCPRAHGGVSARNNRGIVTHVLSPATDDGLAASTAARWLRPVRGRQRAGGPPPLPLFAQPCEREFSPSRGGNGDRGGERKRG